MPTFKIPLIVPQEVYSVLQASAARAGQALPVFVRETLYRACSIDASTLEPAPDVTPALTPTKRAILSLLLKHKGENAGAPYLTTAQVISGVKASDQGVYINLRALLRDGMIERGQNVQRGGLAGAPSKCFAISDLGSRALSDDLARTERVHTEFQARTQAAYSDLGMGNDTPRPQASPDAFKANAHAALRYIAMAQLGRAIESETDIETMKATHARLCEAADLDVSSGAHSYSEILERVTARIQALGGTDAIRERFNIG